MSDGSLHPLAEDYLARLRRIGRALPSDRFRELFAEIRQHLTEVAPADAPEDEVLDALERLGPPGEIVEAEMPAGPAETSTDQRGLREWAAVVLLPLGGFAFGIGWLIGLILLWSSRLWTTRDKLIGTLVVPGGLAVAPFFLLIVSVNSTTGGGCSRMALPVNASTGKAIGHASVRCTTTGGPSTAATVFQIAVAVFVLLGPIVSAIYLARRAGGRRRALVAAGP